jgi:hypothetical protein
LITAKQRAVAVLGPYEASLVRGKSGVAQSPGHESLTR